MTQIGKQQELKRKKRKNAQQSKQTLHKKLLIKTNRHHQFVLIYTIVMFYLEQLL